MKQAIKQPHDQPNHAPITDCAPDGNALALQKLIHFFETLSPESVQKIDQVYAATAYFKDPFNEVHDLAGIQAIFQHMFAQVNQPHFKVHTQVLQGNQAFLAWDFIFSMKRFSNEPQCIKGASHVRFSDTGLVIFHRDYWDAAEELYEKIPLLGSFMRLLKRSAAS